MAGESTELRIYLLGGFRVSLGDQEIPASRWRSTKARDLIKLLALTQDQRLHRDQLMELLWPELEPKAAANNLYQVLFTARRILEPTGTHRFLLLQDENLFLCPGETVWVDVEAFRATINKAQGSYHPADYQAALDLYPGDLLPEDLYKDWADAPRESLRLEHQSHMLAYAQLLERLGEYTSAIGIFQEVHKLYPACEEAHVGLMRCYASLGQRQQAVRSYQALKDVLRRELEVEPAPESTHLYQEILTGQYPPISTPLRKPQHNLPAQLTSFIGRGKEIVQVKKLLSGSRLVTLVGAGGVGKTRLAFRVAEELWVEYPQGVWLVELAPLVDQQYILQAIAAVFGVRTSQNRTLTTELLDYLYEKHILLLLDNCEHLIEACAQYIDLILRTCPNVHILATSRELLGIAGESTYEVPPLSMPDPRHLPPREELSIYDALWLFTERAASALPGFTLNASNSDIVVQICQQLDGLPLAIELAAARVRTLSVHQISARLENIFSLLVGGSRTALSRHQTLRALIDWSHNLLSETEKKLFRRLSIFEGGWTLEAAEAVWEGDQGEVVNLLTQLIHKSLVLVKSEQGEVTRYLFLTTIRQYALEKLAESGEAERLYEDLLRYYLQWGEDVAQKLKAEKGLLLLDRLDEEIDNLRAALRWSTGSAQNRRVGDGLRLATALFYYWFLRGSSHEGMDWLKKGLSLLNDSDLESLKIRAHACLTAGVLQEYYDREEACQFIEESVNLFREAGDKRQIAVAYCQLGHALTIAEIIEPTPTELTRARALAEEGLAISRQLEDKWCLAFALCMNAMILSKTDVATSLRLMKESHELFQETGDELFIEETTAFFSSIALQQGDAATAFQYGQQSLKLARAFGSKFIIMRHLSFVGMAAWFLKDYPQMVACFQEKLALSRELGNKAAIALSLRALGMAALRQGLIQEAAAYFLEGLRKDQEARSEHIQIYLVWLAGIALTRGQTIQATRLMGAIGSDLEAGLAWMEQWDKQEFERNLDVLHVQIDAETFAAAFREGGVLSTEEALAEAIAIGREASLPG